MLSVYPFSQGKPGSMKAGLDIFAEVPADRIVVTLAEARRVAREALEVNAAAPSR